MQKQKAQLQENRNPLLTCTMHEVHLGGNGWCVLFLWRRERTQHDFGNLKTLTQQMVSFLFSLVPSETTSMEGCYKESQLDLSRADSDNLNLYSFQVVYFIYVLLIDNLCICCSSEHATTTNSIKHSPWLPKAARSLSKPPTPGRYC